MPRVRYTADGGHYRVAGVGFDPGDERRVGADLAEYLAGREDFELIGQTDDAPSRGDEPPDESDATADTDDEESAPDESDGFDTDAWLDQGYQERADRVRAGDVDEHLETIADAERSDNVLDAVGERRAELEG